MPIGPEVEVTPKCRTFEQGFDVVAADLKRLMVNRQAKYGHQNILSFGETGVLVRATDKISRLKNFFFPEKGTFATEFLDESITDSWRDLANYSIIALMLKYDVFNLPLAKNIGPSLLEEADKELSKKDPF